MSGDTLDPLVMYSQTYNQSSKSALATAQNHFKEYHDLSKAVSDNKNSYFMHKETADKSDLRIEEHMLKLERGEIEVDALQSVSQNGMLTKYKAELASQHYTKSVNSINTWVKETLH